MVRILKTLGNGGFRPGDGGSGQGSNGGANGGGGGGAGGSFGGAIFNDSNATIYMLMMKDPHLAQIKSSPALPELGELMTLEDTVERFRSLSTEIENIFNLGQIKVLDSHDSNLNSAENYDFSIFAQSEGKINS